MEVSLFTCLITSWNLDPMWFFASGHDFLILGVKKTYDALPMATSNGSKSKSVSSWIKEVTLEYVFAISGLSAIAIPDESSIIETGIPLAEIWEAILYPSVLNP